MPFVSEELSEDQWNSYLAVATKHCTRVLCLSKRIAIDTVRDMVFLNCGGTGELPPSACEPPNGYLLLWHGLAVPFSGYTKNEYSKTTVSLVVTVASIGVPVALEHEFEKIKTAIRDAIACWYGTPWSKNGPRLNLNVIAHFPVPHIY